MHIQHTLQEYIDALRTAGILTDCTVTDTQQKIACLTYDTRTLSSPALFICKGAHFKEEYLHAALANGAVAYASRPRLSSRLTLGGRTFPKKP